MIKTTRRNLLKIGVAAGGCGRRQQPWAAKPLPNPRLFAWGAVPALLRWPGNCSGNQAKLGLDLAMKEINESGGIMGHPLEIIYEDNKTDPKTSVEKVTKLVKRDDVVAPDRSHHLQCARTPWRRR